MPNVIRCQINEEISVGTHSVTHTHTHTLQKTSTSKYDKMIKLVAAAVNIVVMIGCLLLLLFCCWIGWLLPWLGLVKLARLETQQH